jgi:hypothetical protein
VAFSFVRRCGKEDAVVEKENQFTTETQRAPGFFFMETKDPICFLSQRSTFDNAIPHS